MAKAIRKFSSHQLADTRPETTRGRSIIAYAHESVSGFAKAFGDVRKLRGATKGAPTDEEQDLLRALVVFAAAGLDSALKQLIRDGLPSLIRCDDSVRAEFEKFTVRRLKGEDEASDAQEGAKLLARVLTSENPRQKLIEEYVLDLTGASLQSADQVFKTAAALGVSLPDPKIVRGSLTEAFRVRNKIIHELDINFDHPNRNREGRRRDDVIRHANVLLEMAEVFLNGVCQVLNKKG